MFAILGATGKVGRTTAAALRQTGATVRAVVRDPAKAGPLAAMGCEIAVADFHDGAALTKAIAGAAAVQVIVPTNPFSPDALPEMKRSIEAIARAVEAARPALVLAISDYGAESSEDTGITAAFHALEARLRRIPARIILLRSAEHMENWLRVAKPASRTGMLPSMHHPLTKLFPTVSAFDVGAVAADLLLTAEEGDAQLRIVHVEGPRRYTPHEVAADMGAVLGREVKAQELPRAEWAAVLRQAGISESYIALVVQLYDVHNQGKIDVEPGVGETRRGPTTLADALKSLSQSVQASGRPNL